MKKGILFALLMVFGFALVACGETTTEATTAAPTTEAPTTVAPTTEAGDTVAPVFSGVEDVTIYLDVDYDPLTGITATDDVDGDVTDSITAAGSLDTSLEGDYYYIYTVSDEAGNTAQASRYIHVTVDPSLVTDDMVQNGDFSNGTGFWALDILEQSAGTFTVVDEVAVIEVTTASWNKAFPRFSTTEAMTIENGTWYEVSFDAKADLARSIDVQVGDLLDGAPWFTEFVSDQTIGITTDWDTYTFKFLMELDTNEEGVLLFNFGQIGDENFETTIYLDNIAIVESTAEPDTEGPVLSGVEDMEVLLNSDFDPLEGVTATDRTDGDVTVVAANVSGEVDTTTVGDYTISYVLFDSLGNISITYRTISVVEQLTTYDWVGYGWEVTNVDGVATIEYVAGDAWAINAQKTLASFDGTKESVFLTVTGVDGHGYLFKIEGNGASAEVAFTGTGEEQEVELDLSGLTEAQRSGLNLMVLFRTTPTDEGTLVVHGWDYTSALVTTWIGYGWDVVMDGEEATVTYVAGDPWAINVQASIPAFDGTKESVILNVTGVDGHGYLFKIEGGGASQEVAFTGTGAPQEVELDLSGLTQAQREGLNLMIVFRTTPTDAGTLVIHGWSYGETAAPAWIGYGWDVVLDGEEATVTYVAGDPWAINVQGTIADFDETKEAIVLNITAVDGHNYLFKIEGGGASQEVAFTGTGAPQEVELDLSGLTEAQRAGLNLMIIFRTTPTDSGTFVIHGWDYVLPTWIGYGMDVVIDSEDTATVTYTATAGDWWVNNVQNPFDSFTGTYEEISFTFTGETGQLYLFKIEGGGAAYEMDVTATGSEQTVVMDLSGLTEAQRSGLNLVIVFSKDASQAGTFVVSTFEYVEPTV